MTTLVTFLLIGSIIFGVIGIVAGVWLNVLMTKMPEESIPTWMRVVAPLTLYVCSFCITNAIIHLTGGTL